MPLFDPKIGSAIKPPGDEIFRKKIKRGYSEKRRALKVRKTKLVLTSWKSEISRRKTSGYPLDD
jgi:hypothetical protein